MKNILLFISFLFSVQLASAQRVRAQAASKNAVSAVDTLVADWCDPNCSTAASWSWGKMSGPGIQTVSGNLTPTAIINGLQTGFYIWQVTVKNSSGIVYTDTVGFNVSLQTAPPVITPVQNCDTTNIKLDSSWALKARPVVYDTVWTVTKVPITITRACPVVIAKPVSIFTTQTPPSATGNDHQSTVGIETGTTFTSSASGFITGIRFYKTAGNTGSHTGELYFSSGVRITSAVFTAESASGWQTVTFPTPVAITAGTSYVAAVFSAAGNYASTGAMLSKPVVSSQLTATANGGVYIYSKTAAFPKSTYNGSFYWVDLIYSITKP